MTERQADILTTLINAYIRTAEPVGSGVLVGRYGLPYSSATVRAECAELEREGYVSSPHTSAGRVPTARGYRFLVDESVRTRGFSRAEAARLQEHLLRAAAPVHCLARETAKVLAGLSKGLAVTGVMDRREFHEAGFDALLDEPEFEDVGRLRDVTRILDAFDDHAAELMARQESAPRVYIGEENPYVRTRHVSVIMTTCDVPSGERGLLAIIGPTRMRYDRNVALLEALSRVIEEGSVA